MDHNPKDFIIFDRGVFTASHTGRDNTGRGFFEDAVFPTLTFPSDHALVSSRLHKVKVMT